jgi:hypothetical protein
MPAWVNWDERGPRFARGQKAKWQKGQTAQGNSVQAETDPQPDVVDAAARRDPVTKGGAAAPRIVAPGTTTQHAGVNRTF